MLLIVSPSKTMEPFFQNFPFEMTKPQFVKETKELMGILQKMSKSELSTFMSLSDKLTEQNYQRFQEFYNKKIPATPAALTYTGEVFAGLNAKNWDQRDFDYAQSNLRILSGLYGCLKPKDAIKPYRLEMASRLVTSETVGLYQFWSEKITSALCKDLKSTKSNIICNLASEEYFKVLKTKNIKATIIDFEFYEIRNGKRTFVSFSAKQARGLMASYIVRNSIENPELLKDFKENDYMWDAETSTPTNFKFLKFIS